MKRAFEEQLDLAYEEVELVQDLNKVQQGKPMENLDHEEQESAYFDGDVKRNTDLSDRDSIQVLTDVAMENPHEVLVLYTFEDGSIHLQSNGLSRAEAVYLLEFIKTSLLE